jgi:hypothetical protein
MNRHFIDLIPSSLSRTKLFILMMGCLLPIFVFSQESITESLKKAEIEEVKDGFIVYGMNEDATEFKATKYDRSLKKIKSYSKTFPNKTRFWETSPYYFAFHTRGEGNEITNISLNEMVGMPEYSYTSDSIRMYATVDPDWRKINPAMLDNKFLTSTKNKSWFVLTDAAKQKYSSILYCFDNASGNVLYQQELSDSDEVFTYSCCFFDSITENIIIAGNYSATKNNNKLFSKNKNPLNSDSAEPNGTVYIGITAEGKIYSRKKYSFPEHNSKIDLSIHNTDEQFSIIHHIIKENSSNYIVIAENVRKKIAKGGTTNGGIQGGGNYNAGPSTYMPGAGAFWASMGFSIMKLNNSLDALDHKIFTCECHSDNSYNNSEVVFKNNGFSISVTESLLSDFIFNHNTQQGLLLYFVKRYSNDQKCYYAITLNDTNSIKYPLEDGSKKSPIDYFIKDEKSLFKFSVNSKEGTYTLEVVPVM